MDWTVVAADVIQISGHVLVAHHTFLQSARSRQKVPRSVQGTRGMH
jgi:hypothetical protein